MKVLAIICLMALAGCGAQSSLRALDLEGCSGWEGGAPTTERELLEAAAAERFGRLCANSKLEAVRALDTGRIMR